MQPVAHANHSRRQNDVEGGVCFLDERGQVQCDFAAPKRSRVLNPSANGKPTGLPPGCAVDLSTGRWACPGHAVDGVDAKVQRVFTDDAGHTWALAGESSVVVPAVRSVTVGAAFNGGQGQGHEVQGFNSQPGQPNRNRTMNAEQTLLALYGGGNQNGIAVGGCGNNFAGNGFPGGMAGQGPGCDPYPPPIGNMVQPCAIDRTCFTPVGFACGVDEAGRVYSRTAVGLPSNTSGLVSAPSFRLLIRNSTLWAGGIRIFNSPGQVMITGLFSGDSDTNQFMGEADAATYNTDNCWCPVNFGCISSVAALTIGIRAIPPVPVVVPDIIRLFSGTLFGVRTSTMFSCGPQFSCG